MPIDNVIITFDDNLLAFSAKPLGSRYKADINRLKISIIFLFTYSAVYGTIHS